VAPSRRIRAFAGLAVAALALTGCAAGSSAASAQTPEQACDVLASGVAQTTAKLQTSISGLATDPEAAADDVTALTADFENSASGVDNAELKRLANNTTTALADFDEKIHAYASEPAAAANQEAMQTSAENVQTAIAAIGESCS